MENGGARNNENAHVTTLTASGLNGYCRPKSVTFGDLSRQKECKGEGDAEGHCKELFERLVHVETHPNGGASVVHMYQEDLTHLSAKEMQLVAAAFFQYVSGQCVCVCQRVFVCM